MYLRKLHILTLTGIFVLFTVGCNLEPEVWEEVIERFPTGEKKVVAIYRGKGVSEKLVFRTTFDIRGSDILTEDLIKNTKKNWAESYPQYATRIGLKFYLQGKWRFKREDQIITTYGEANFTENEFTMINKYIAKDTKKEFTTTSKAKIEYFDNLRFKINRDSETETFIIKLISKHKMILSSNEKKALFERVDNEYYAVSKKK